MQRKKQMISKSHGSRTVPQIFIADTHIGGYDDLYKLYQENKLEELVNLNHTKTSDCFVCYYNITLFYIPKSLILA